MFKKNFKKIVATALTAAMMMGMSTSIFAVDTSTTASSGADGKKLTANEFNNTYCVPNYSASSTLSLSTPSEVATMEVVSARSSDTTAELSLNITTDGITTNVVINGELFLGYKQQDGRNSIVGDMTTNNDALKVVLFEIFDDTATDSLLVNPSLNGTPHMKIYFEDSANEVLLFETELPNELRNASYNTESDISSFKDIFWFIGIAEPQESKELPVDEEMKRFMGIEDDTNLLKDNASRAIIMKTWSGNTTYYKSFYIGSDLYKCWSLANGNMNMPDKIGASDVTWTSTFNVAEHTTVNGTTYRNVDNPFHFQNVKLDMSASDSVTFVNSNLNGKLVDSDGSVKGSGKAIASLIYSVAMNYIPYGGTIDTAIGFISQMDSKPSTITLGANNSDIYGSITPAIGYGMGSYQEVFKNTSTTGGHSIKLQATSQSLVNGSSKTGYAVMQTSWDVYYMGNIIGGEYEGSGMASNNLRYQAS